METMLVINGWEIEAPPDEQEKIILNLAAGQLDRESFIAWLRLHAKEIRPPEPTKTKRQRYRHEKGQFAEVLDVGKSLSQDRKRKAKTTVPSGQGDKGDQKKR